MKRIIVGYLLVSSVLLHIAALVLAILFGYWMKSAVETGQEWARGATESAIVRDVSELNDGEYSSLGYSLEYKGKPLYVTGSPNDNAHIGDEVGLMISKHPYAPLKNLMIVVEPCKKKPR